MPLSWSAVIAESWQHRIFLRIDLRSHLPEHVGEMLETSARLGTRHWPTLHSETKRSGIDNDAFSRANATSAQGVSCL